VAFEVKVPAVGESITEATIGEWSKADGDYVERDEIILVLETDKASVEVVAETAGALKLKAEEGDTVEIGAVVAEIDESAAPSAGASEAKEEAPAEKKDAPGAAPANDIHASLKEELAPAVRKIVTENNLDPKSIQGTGKDGRVTKRDIFRYLENRKDGQEFSKNWNLGFLCVFLLFLSEEIKNEPSGQKPNEIPEIRDRLTTTANSGEHTVPTHSPIGDTLPKIVKTHPKEYGLAHNVVCWYISPSPAVLGMVAVVTHHPVIVLLKGIGVGLLPVNEHFGTSNLHIVVFIIANDFLVQGDGPRIDGYGGSCFWNINRTKVVVVPWVKVRLLRECISSVHAFRFYGLNHRINSRIISKRRHHIVGEVRHT